MALVIRHGETEWNRARRIIGQRDPELNHTGVRDAQALAGELKDVPLSRVFSSPLRRAVRTAEIVVGGRALDVILEPALLEASFGRIEGEFMDRDSVRQEWELRAQDKYTYVPPGGESYLNLESRLLGFFGRVPLSREDLLVTHVGVIRTLAHLFGGLDRAAAGDLTPGHRDVWLLDVDGRTFTLGSNDKSSSTG